MDLAEQSTTPKPPDAGARRPQNEGKRPSPKPSVSEVTEMSHRSSEYHSSAADGAVASEDGAQWVTGRDRAILLTLISVAVFLMMLDTSIIATAIPRITDEFHSLQDVGWYVSIYQLACAAVQPLSGKIYHRFSNKFSFLAFFTIFEIGSIICGSAASSGTLIVGRAIAGIGSAGLVSGGLTILAAAVPLEKRALLTGLILGFAQVGIAIGPVVGGALTSFVTWRWCFYINLPIGGLLAGALFFVRIPDQVEKRSARPVLRRLHLELDLFGFALLASAAVQLLLALSWGGSKYAWSSATIIGLFCGSSATTLLWLAWDWYRGDEALLIVLPLTVARTGYVIPYAMSSAIIGSISNGLYSTFSPTTPMSKLAGYQVLNGVGRGLGMQMAILAVQASISPDDLAMGNSMVIFMQTLGTAIMLAVSDAIFEAGLESELPKHAPLADVAAIVAAGATHFRDIVGEQDLPGALVAYSLAIDRVFYLAAGVSALGVCTSLCLGWVDVRKRQRPGNQDTELRRFSV
ncbi:major facilitator superfamily domain-containing protein [Chaetomidium leptoderma]|uniref:Major facilitator superfamily domain-containing protein n=1 Tax=Chaetomidium leptoderma TaxID=669021 RepID=A0AAN6VSI1_9PEZI|nr:major facilitator superfamily domain-containing protein [Chaetomidium leptoderma]